MTQPGRFLTQEANKTETLIRAGAERLLARATNTRALDVDAVSTRARTLVDKGQPVLAIHLAEAVLRRGSDDVAARAVMADAHQALLADGGDESFWESGWLRDQLARYRAR